MKLLSSSSEISIFCHQNADPDAICSAFAMQFLIKKLQRKARVKIITVGGISKITKRLMELISISTISKPLIKNTDIIIIVDTNNLRLLGKWGNIIEKSGIPLILVDHHTPHPRMNHLATCMICNENASSTCEILFEMFKILKIKYTKKIAKAILMGIICDTRHFILASSQTLIDVAELIKNGARVEEAMSVLEIPMSQSEIFARLKAIQRMDFLKTGEWLIAYTKISSYQSSAARIITYIGAQVAIVGGIKKDSLRISLRSTKDFFKKTGIHLGRDIAIPIGEILNGVGGGHAMAAGINGTGDLDNGIQKCVEKIKSMLD